MKKSLVAGTMLAAAVASVASAGFTGYSVQRTITAGGNIQYQVFANWDQSGLVFLNAFNFATQSGTMNARHQDFFVEDGEVGTWQAGSSVSAADRAEDSWVTASGLATASGWGSALDPGFANGGTVGDINNGAGWYDATPGTPNAIAAGGTQGGYRILLAQIVRNGNDADALATFYLKNAYKVAGTTTALFAEGTFSIGVVPAPGALALLGLAGMAGRRRR
ncbi:MAG: hypothetical protein RJA05_577 [Planctomycetota bacterium]|jgi:hypothetical protein